MNVRSNMALMQPHDQSIFFQGLRDQDDDFGEGGWSEGNGGVRRANR